MPGVSLKADAFRTGRLAPGGVPTVRNLLQWIYLGRVLVAVVLFVAAAIYFQTLPPETILVLAAAALASVITSTLSAWHTHIRAVEPGITFLYAQVLVDLGLVTTVVHVTGGPESQFPALYILVIAFSSVTMPLRAGLLVTSLASLLYLGDIVWLQPVALSVAVWLQIAVFLGVFLVTGLVAGRLRQLGAEQVELRETVRRLRLEAGDILRNIRSGVITVDGDGLLAYANPAAREILGLETEDIIGRHLGDLLRRRSPELVRAIVLTQETKQKSYRAEGQIRLSGRVFPIGLTTTALDTDDGVPSVTAIFTDISDQKRIEALHLRTERLEAVAELSASLAHEIKNPLASIRSSVEQLSRSALTDADDRVLAGLVVQESDRLSRLLSEFLDFSRVRVTSSHLLDLAVVARSAVDVVRKHPDCPEEASLELRTEETLVDGDEDLLHRVVVNLVLNAVQASGDSGEVTIEVRHAGAGELPPGVLLERAALIRVTDNGPGIPDELRERLFDPFVTGRAGGSGLGLAIVQRAVQAHRGVVLVDSRAGRTTFEVLLPGKDNREVAA